jgi:hypothetical protein
MIKTKDRAGIVPVVITCLIIITAALIPYKIVRWGYMPKDDATRHAAKIISQKSWDEILVLRGDIRLDNHPGWHAILGFVHRAAGLNAYQLVIFSVFILFLLFSLVPVLSLERPEAWVLTLLTIAVLEPVRIARFLLGRPFLVTMAAIMAILFMWEGLAGKKMRRSSFAAIAAWVAAATWIHGGWYFFTLPVAALFLARQYRAGVRLALAAAVGAAIGALLAGHPIAFLAQTLKHAFLAFSDYKVPGVLVTEFQPFLGDGPIVVAVILLLMWRAIRGEWGRKTVDNPVAILALLSWALGFVTTRVWIDIGMAAALVWMAREFQAFLSKSTPPGSPKALAAAAAASIVLFLAVTNDAGNRWSQNKPMPYITFDAPEMAAWAPGKGGIVYNSDMRIFYNMFYKNPKAPWRYIMGFEPGIMPPEDLAIYRNIQLNFGPDSFMPWVRKLRPEDRLVIFDPTGMYPQIKELEWRSAGDFIWIGRKRR